MIALGYALVLIGVGLVAYALGYHYGTRDALEATTPDTP